MSEAPYRQAPEAKPHGLARVASEASVYAVSAFVGRALALVALPLYTHRLGAEGYGALELLNTLDLVVIAAFSTPIADPVLRHYHDAPDEDARRAVVSTAILSVAALGALVTAAGTLASDAIARAIFREEGRGLLVTLTFLSVTFQAALEVPIALLRGTGRAWTASAWGIARTALGFALNVTFIVGFEMGVLGMTLSTFVASTVVASAACAATLRETGLRFEPAALRRMFAFGWPLVPGALAFIALGHTRSYVLNHYGTREEVGAWAFGYAFGALIAQALGHPLRAAWMARMYALWDDPDGLGPARYRRAGTWFVALFAWAAAAITAVTPELVRTLAPPSFARAVVVVPASAAAYAVRELAEYFRNGLLVGRDTRSLAGIEPALALVDLAIGVALVSRWGLEGAAAASLLVYGLYAVALHAAVRRVLPVRYEYGRMAACAALAVAVGALGLAMPVRHLAAAVALKVMLVAAYPVAVFALVLRDDDDRALLRALWAMARRRG